jgi:hypothetical protein
MSEEMEDRPLFISQFKCSQDFLNALKGLSIHQIEYNYSEDFNCIEEDNAELRYKISELQAALNHVLTMQTRGFVVLGNEFTNIANKALEDRS